MHVKWKRRGLDENEISVKRRRRLQCGLMCHVHNVERDELFR